jgi:histone H3/H4
MVKDFSILAMEKILKKAGKEVGADRVATSATEELKNVLLELSEKIALEAVAASHHAKRVTVKREDIQMAIR